eukprot:317210_1
MLQQAVKLCQQLIQSIYDPESQVWGELYDIHENSSGINNLSPNEFNTILLQQKQFCFTNDNKNNVGSIEHILKYLKFYGYHDGRTFYGYHQCDRTSYENRANCLGHMTICVVFCCITFEKFDLMKQLITDPSVMTSAVLPFVTDFPNLYTSSDYEDIFYNTFLSLHTNTNPDWQLILKVQTGFLMIFGKDCIENMLSNKTEKEVQKQIISNSLWEKNTALGEADVIQLSKKIIIWRDNLDMYGKILVYDVMKMDPNDRMLGSYQGNVVYLVAKMYYINHQYLEAKITFINAIRLARSFVVIALSLEHLSKLCKYYGEHGIGLRCLKLAYKLCCIGVRNDTFILPSFVERRYTKQKRSFMNQFDKIRCGYCGMKKGVKLRSCSGCMKVMYCNKKC